MSQNSEIEFLRGLTVTDDGLSVVLKRAQLTVRRQASEKPDLLPPPVAGTKPRIWRMETVWAWMADKEGLGPAQLQVAPNPTAIPQPQQPVKRGRGRPRTEAWHKGAGGAA